MVLTVRQSDRAAWLALLTFATLFVMLASPAFAHEEHRKARAEAARLEQLASQGAIPAAAKVDPDVMHAQMGEMMEGAGDRRSRMTGFERFLDWLGRLHPMIVHFPIAFFPAALFTAIVGRRRPAYGTPVRFLVVAGGILAPIAALLGWFDGGFAPSTDDAMLGAHRWLGTAIGAGALGLGVWAWRRPDQDRGPGMIIGLSVITAAIVVQGWFGGALVHGIDHLNW